MDSFTHIALGACVGEAFFERGFGKKAMWWGALAQSVPDVDFIASFWMETAEELLAHRGFTHSFFFAALAAPSLALAADRIHQPHRSHFKKWLAFFTVEILLHLFLDGFNNYGTGWFEPFSHQRFSFNAIYVADPFFSIWPGIAFLVLLVLNRWHPMRGFWWKLGVVAPLIYLAYCSTNKIRIDREVREIFTQQGIPHERYLTTPTPLNNWLWYTVAGNDSGYYVGYRSVFDSRKEMQFEYFPRNDYLLDSLAPDEEVSRLVRFSQGFYTLEKWGDTLVFNDLRFGQIVGWKSPREHFVFHYFLKQQTGGRQMDNSLVVQRGRFARFDREAFRSMVRRIRGSR